MKQDNRKRKQPDDEIKYRSDVSRGTTCMLIGIAAALFGDTALYFRWWPMVLLMFVTLLISVVWLVRERQRKDRIDYENYCRIRRAISTLEGKIDGKKEDDFFLNLDQDKPIKSNVRPGSRPSEEYKAMIGGEVLDAGRKD